MAPSTHSKEKYAVFGFGVIYLSAILVLVVLIPEPSQAQFFAFRLTMALSAAGIGALVPGFLNLHIPFPLGGVRAGGALALFASVWFVNPATLGIVEVQVPKEDARILSKQFLDLTDASDHSGAYELFAERTRERVNKNDYVSMGNIIRDPLGNKTKRLLNWIGTPDEINGVHGPFVVHVYQSRFENTEDIWVELVSTIPENNRWRIDAYNIHSCQPPNCQPMEPLLK